MAKYNLIKNCAGDAIIELLTVEETAEILRIEVQTLYKWMREGRIPYIKPSNRLVLFKKEAIIDFIDGAEVFNNKSGSSKNKRGL